MGVRVARDRAMLDFLNMFLVTLPPNPDQGLSSLNREKQMTKKTRQQLRRNTRSRRWHAFPRRA